MSLWDNLFSHLRVPVAQILLTRNDIADVCIPVSSSLMSLLTVHISSIQRTQYVNAQNTFEQLFDMGVIPIVNENDTLAVSVRKLRSKTALPHLTSCSFQGNQIWRQRYPVCDYCGYDQS
jgi:glutamate 5-kinase